jgi:nucleolin
MDRKRGSRKYSDSDNESRSEEVQDRKRQRRDSNSRSSERGDRRKESRSRNRDDSRDRDAPERREKSDDECCELFVRNLPWKADEQVVSEFFSKFGKVENVKILYDRETGKAKGIGFVKFDSRSDAEKAIASGDDLEMDGRKVEVNYSNQRKERPSRDSGRDNGRDDRRREANPESKTIFVGNLSFKTSEDSIRDFFTDCGNIEDVRIASQDGKSKGFCHLEFDSIHAASKAMKKNGEDLDGRDVRVDFSQSRREGGNDRGDRFGGSRGGFRGGSRGGSSKFYFDFKYVILLFVFIN